MAKNPKKEPPPDEMGADIADADDEVTAELQEFSDALARRFPKRTIKRYTMPKSVRECREVFMIEVTSRDEVQAAIEADRLMSADERRSQRLSNDAERRVCVRLSIVGVLDGSGYRHANADGVPFVEADEWTSKAWAALQTYYGTLNGVPMEELAMGLMGAQTVGAFVPPTSATRASASNGK